MRHIKITTAFLFYELGDRVNNVLMWLKKMNYEHSTDVDIE